MRPEFSIITICFNEAKNIRRTCESIASQSRKNIEWIVIDGGSTDGTLDILEEFRGSIHHFISEADHGIYDAMNKGIGLASGEYLVFMNGGDSFASTEVLEWIHASPQKDLIYGDIFYDCVDGRIEAYPDKLSNDYMLKKMLPHQATFYHRQLFEKYGLYDASYKIAGDYDFFARILKTGEVSYYHINKPLAVFDNSGISSSSKQRSRRKEENHRVRMKHFPQYRWTLKAWRQCLRKLLTKTRPKP